MQKINNNLQSGNQYSLEDIFSDERKVVVPDLQRDYCWGDKTHGKEKKELVSGFVTGLMELFTDAKNKEHQMGMLYAYENPIDHIQLCDGQQRITTLYLLLGMLYRKINRNEKYNERIKNFLISDFELNEDDKEPHLQYAIRESTLYFLSDLVCEFFIDKNELKPEEIKKQKWYFSEYDLDPTIQSMLSALMIIEERMADDSEFEFREFSVFLLEKIKFFYFDMKNRQHGEEMFVVINTTGEPLTSTENLKPLLIGNIEDEEKRQIFSEKWEKWESYFWKNKLEKEHEADSGLNDFLVWYWQIKLKQENDWANGKKQDLKPIKLFKEHPEGKKENSYAEFSFITKADWEKAASLDEVDKYFEQYKVLCNYFQEDGFKHILDPDNKKLRSPRQFLKKQEFDFKIILPLLAYMVKFPDRKEEHRLFLRRLRKNYYDGIWKDRSNYYVDWRHIIEIIENCETLDEVLKFSDESTLKKIPNVISNIKYWYNAEALQNNKFVNSYRVEIEEWEDHEDFMGDLEPLFNASDYLADINSLNNCFNVYNNITGHNPEYFKNKNELYNIYQLFLYVIFGRFEHRSVAGWGYCMLKTYEDRLLLKEEFIEIWKLFNNSEEKVFSYIKEKLKMFFKEVVLKHTNGNIEKMTENPIENIKCHETVWLWAFLEYLHCDDNEKLVFSNSIACFWDYPNLVQIEEKKKSDKNNYKLGNLKLGTSYYNNRSGWLNYNYSLMNELNRIKLLSEEEIESKTAKYKEKIETFLRN